jgi:hypothetical protein
VLELLILAVACTLVVSLRGEPTQTFMIDIYAEGIDSKQCHVDTQIEFQIVDEEGIIDVVADDE